MLGRGGRVCMCVWVYGGVYTYTHVFVRRSCEPCKITPVYQDGEAEFYV